MAAAIGVAALAGLMQAAFGWTDNPFSGSDSTFSYLDGSYYLRPGGTFSTFYLLPISVAFLVPVQLAWFSLQTQAGKRLIIVFILVLSATACIIAAERLPIVGMIVGLMLWLIFVIGQERRKSKVNQEGMQWGWVVAAIAIGLAVGVWIFSPELAWTRMLSILEPSQDESLMTRIAIYNSAMSLFFANPILGVGLGQFDFLLPLYGYFQAQGPHSTVLRVLGEHGLIGFLLFYGALLWCLAKAYHAMTYCVQQHIYELSLIAFAVFGSLGVYLFMSLFLEYLSYNRYLGLIIGVGIWLERHVRLLRAERNAAEIK
ncbi:O-antigen ligase family protein [Candidatus Woesearchaeota archaeon]|nr:O-antigen ligase family protein [Candidatus Woesearchaeota archaeon]